MNESFRKFRNEKISEAKYEIKPDEKYFGMVETIPVLTKG